MAHYKKIYSAHASDNQGIYVYIIINSNTIAIKKPKTNDKIKLSVYFYSQVKIVKNCAS